MDETVGMIHKRELNENNAPLSLQMMSPGRAAYIRAPDVGHYLQQDTVNCDAFEWIITSSVVCCIKNSSVVDQLWLKTNLYVWSSGIGGWDLCSEGSGWRWDLGGLGLTEDAQSHTDKKTGLERALLELLLQACLQGDYVRRWASGEPCSLKSQDILSYTSTGATEMKQFSTQYSLSRRKITVLYPDTKNTPKDLIYRHYIKLMRHISSHAKRLHRVIVPVFLGKHTPVIWKHADLLLHYLGILWQMDCFLSSVE